MDDKASRTWRILGWFFVGVAVVASIALGDRFGVKDANGAETFNYGLAIGSFVAMLVVVLPYFALAEIVAGLGALLRTVDEVDPPVLPEPSAEPEPGPEPTDPAPAGPEPRLAEWPSP